MQSFQFPAGRQLPKVCISGFSLKSHRIFTNPPGLHQEGEEPSNNRTDWRRRRSLFFSSSITRCNTACIW